MLVLKTSSRWCSKHILKTSSARLQRNNFTSSKTFCTHLARRPEDVLEDGKLLRWGNLQEVCLTRIHRLFGQTTKQPLSNFGPKNLENISNFELLINKNKCIEKLWEKHLKKKVRKGTASLLKTSLWDSSQFLLVQINHLVSP